MKKNISCWTLCYFFALYCLLGTTIVRKPFSWTAVQLYIYQICTYLFDLMLDILWKKYDILTQCVQNLVIPYVLLFFFYILSPWGDNNIDVQSDLIFARSEEVYTSDHIDEFITSQKTCLRWKYILIFFFLIFISICSQEIIHEIKVKKRGQHNIPSWVSAQAARIPA